MNKLDKIDRAIIAHLQVVGRMPFTEIATRLKVSEGTVRHRVIRLTDIGVLQVAGTVEPQLLDWNAAGMIGVGVQAGMIEEAAAEITRFPEATYLFMASGGYDLFVEV